jgi:hypothetical protein
MTLYQAQENLRMLEKCPTWYDHLDAINAATAEWDRVYAIRTKAGWDLDEGGWYAPCPETRELIPEWDWLAHGLLYPEDL